MKNVYENFHENIVDEKFSKKKIIKKKTEDFFCNFLKYYFLDTLFFLSNMGINFGDEFFSGDQFWGINLVDQ